MDGKDSVFTGGAGVECRRGSVPRCLDLDSGAGVLLGDLPLGSDAGHYFVVKREKEEKEIPLLVFPGGKMVAIRGVGRVYRGIACRNWFVGGIVCPV